MITLHTTNQRIGTWRESEEAFEKLVRVCSIEFRNEEANVILGTVFPIDSPFTEEEVRRRLASPGMSLAEIYRALDVK